MLTLSQTVHFEKSAIFEEDAKDFQKRFHLAEALKSANAYKSKGFSVIFVFMFLFNLVFTGKSLYRFLSTAQSATICSKDTFYRFLNSTSINWQRFVNLLARNVIREVERLTSKNRKNVFIIDDTPIKRRRSKQVELAAKQFDHTDGTYYCGYRLLTTAWSDGNTTVPVDFALLSSEKKKEELPKSCTVHFRSCSYTARKEAVMKATDVVMSSLSRALKTGCKASYVLFDTWFTSPTMLQKLRNAGLHVISMVRKSNKIFYCFNGELMTEHRIYNMCRKRRGRSKYLLSVDAELYRKGTTAVSAVSVPVRMVFVRKTASAKKNYLVLLSTDLTLTPEEIIALYKRRWSIEVLFKVCKTYLRLGKESRGVSYDAMRAYVAISFSRYMMLAWEQRCASDDKTAGELFYALIDEMAEPSWIEALKELLSDITGLYFSECEQYKAAVDNLILSFLEKLPKSMNAWLKQVCFPLPA